MVSEEPGVEMLDGRESELPEEVTVRDGGLKETVILVNTDAMLGGLELEVIITLGD